MCFLEDKCPSPHGDTAGDPLINFHEDLKGTFAWVNKTKADTFHYAVQYETY